MREGQKMDGSVDDNDDDDNNNDDGDNTDDTSDDDQDDSGCETEGNNKAKDDNTFRCLVIKISS